MKKLICLALAAAAAVACSAKGKLPWIKGVTDKSPVEYKACEKMTFTLELKNAE